MKMCDSLEEINYHGLDYLNHIAFKHVRCQIAFLRFPKPLTCSRKAKRNQSVELCLVKELPQHTFRHSKYREMVSESNRAWEILLEIQAPCFYMPCEIVRIILVCLYLVVGTVPQHLKRTTLSVKVKAENVLTLAGLKSLL